MAKGGLLRSIEAGKATTEFLIMVDGFNSFAMQSSISGFVRFVEAVRREASGLGHEWDG